MLVEVSFRPLRQHQVSVCVDCVHCTTTSRDMLTSCSSPKTTSST